MSGDTVAASAAAAAAATTTTSKTTIAIITSTIITAITANRHRQTFSYTDSLSPH